MTRLQASILVLVLWAAIYLPGLGSTELKGEEGRRILPAVTMLETGDWLVPYVGGKPFLRKPPLVNWAIATAFKLTGVRNEWTARLPSALCVLALGLTIVGTSGPGWMTPGTAFVGALMAMTQFGLMAKARFAGAEIEGIYAPLSGIAIVCWHAGWSRKGSPWLFWTVSGFFLGLASLAKGPSFHLLFFYVIVFTVLGRSRRWWDALHPAHFAGLAISAGLFAAWAVPYFKTPEAKEAAAVWKRQGIDRFTDSEFNAENYFLNIPRGLMDQLPWLLLVPAFWRKKEEGAVPGHAVDVDDEELLPATQKSVLYATVATFTVLLLVPGTLPRYALPLGAPFTLVLAQALVGRERIWKNWNFINRLLAGLVILFALAVPVVACMPMQKGGGIDIFGAIRGAFAATLAIGIAAAVLARRRETINLPWVGGSSAALLGAMMLLYGAAAIRWINRKDDVRPAAAAVDAAMPAGENLTIYDPGYLATIFYLRTPYVYATVLEEISPAAQWVLIRGKERKKFAAKRPDLAVVQTIPSKGGEELLLLHREPATQKLPAR